MVRFKGLEYYYLTTLASVLWTVCDAELTDAKAEDKSLDSVYKGELTVQWSDPGHKDCEVEFGPINGTTLRFGPSRVDGDPYYLQINTPPRLNSKFIFNLRSSATDDDNSASWWDLGADQPSPKAGYDLKGRLTKKPPSKGDLDNHFSGSLSAGNTKACGLQAGGAFFWNHAQKSITFSGTATPGRTTLSGFGIYKSPDKNLEVTYLFSFTGVWDSTSAKLSVSKKLPTWPEPGTSGKKIVTTKPVPVTKTAFPTATFNSASVLAIPTSLPDIEDLLLTTTTPTPEPTISKPAPSSNLSKGVVAGIVVAAVAGVLLLGSLIWVLYRRWDKKKNQVYPELAWLYTPSTPGLYPSGRTASGQSMYTPVDMDYAIAGGGYRSPPPVVSSAYAPVGWDVLESSGAPERSRGRY